MDTLNPPFLYKYRAVNELSLSALSQGRVWYSMPSGLNDPHDVAARWQKEFTDQEIVEDYVMMREVGSPVTGIADHIRDLIKKGWSYTSILKFVDDLFIKIDGKTQRELLQDVLYYNEVIFNSMGVFSLSEDPVQPLMWAHYSASHTGFCLGFENHETSVVGQYGNKVDYFEKMPKPNIRSFQEDGGGEVVGLIAYSKSKDWEYEKEWRILKQSGNKLYPYPGILSEVVLGIKIDPDDEAKVREAVSKSGYRPEYKRVVRTDGEYELKLESCK